MPVRFSMHFSRGCDGVRPGVCDGGVGCVARLRSTDTLCNPRGEGSPLGWTTFAVVEVGRSRSAEFTWNCPYREKVDLRKFLWDRRRRADDNGNAHSLRVIKLCGVASFGIAEETQFYLHWPVVPRLPLVIVDRISRRYARLPARFCPILCHCVERRELRTTRRAKRFPAILIGRVLSDGLIAGNQSRPASGSIIRIPAFSAGSPPAVRTRKLSSWVQRVQ